MDTKDLLNVCGSVTKKESLLWLTTNILEHTHVAEANMPYSSYYGHVPGKAEPNSLFLFTGRYYTLEESLSISQNIDLCARNRVNVASAVLLMQNHRFPAIRIRNFPDYAHLEMLQQCYQKQGVQFARKVIREDEALVTVNKCFVLEKLNDHTFLDKCEKNEGYIAVPKHLNQREFESLMKNVWNNAGCLHFDAARGGLIINGIVTDIIRIYSEHFTGSLLECIRKEVIRQMENWNAIMH